MAGRTSEATMATPRPDMLNMEHLARSSAPAGAYTRREAPSCTVMGASIYYSTLPVHSVSLKKVQVRAVKDTEQMKETSYGWKPRWVTCQGAELVLFSIQPYAHSSNQGQIVCLTNVRMELAKGCDKPHSMVVKVPIFSPHDGTENGTDEWYISFLSDSEREGAFRMWNSRIGWQDCICSPLQKFSEDLASHKLKYAYLRGASICLSKTSGGPIYRTIPISGSTSKAIGAVNGKPHCMELSTSAIEGGNQMQMPLRKYTFSFEADSVRERWVRHLNSHAQLPPVVVQKVFKLAQSKNKWQERWLVARNGAVHYFKTAVVDPYAVASPNHTLFLTSESFATETVSREGKGHTFTINLHSPGAASRELVFSAGNDQCRADIVQAITAEVNLLGNRGGAADSHSASGSGGTSPTTHAGSPVLDGAGGGGPGFLPPTPVGGEWAESDEDEDDDGYPSEL